MRIGVVLALAPLFGCASRPAVQRASGATEGPAAAFIDVTVVPMDREQVLPHQTVVVRDTRIAEVGPTAGVHVPPGARRIDGHGKYLMPGLADMHSHPESVLDLMMYVANGVTT